MKIECLKHGETEGTKIDGRLKCKKCLKEIKDSEQEEKDPEKEKFVKKFMRDMAKKYHLDSRHGKEFGPEKEESGKDMEGFFESILGGIFNGKDIQK